MTEPQVRETVREFLARARKRIEDPVHWTQGCYARNRRGDEVDARSEEAMSWCAAGALDFEPNRDRWEIVHKYVAKAIKDDFDDGWSDAIEIIAAFNDSHDHAAVIAIFDKAIGLAEQELLRADKAPASKRDAGGSIGMATEKTWQEIVALKDHYLAIGQDKVYLHGEGEKPWHLVTEVRSGGLWRHNTSVNAYAEAVVGGLTLDWSIDFETRDANGTAGYRFDVLGLMEALRSLPDGPRQQLYDLLDTCLNACRHEAQQAIDHASRQLGQVEVLRRSLKSMEPIEASS